MQYCTLPILDNKSGISPVPDNMTAHDTGARQYTGKMPVLLAIDEISVFLCK
jgi:hypothetical protein